MSETSSKNRGARTVIRDREVDRDLRRQEEGESAESRRRGHRRPKPSCDDTKAELDPYVITPGLLDKDDLAMPVDQSRKSRQK